MRNARKWLSVLLAVVLIVGLLPATALAIETYPVWVGGVQVDASNAKDVLSDGGRVVFTPATESEPARLRLYNADIVGTSLPAYPDDNDGIYSEIDLTLEIHAWNKITCEDAVSDADSYGIYVKDANLVIEGDGTLDVTAGKGKNSYAVDTDEMTVLGGTVQATGGDATVESAAVRSGAFVMEGGTLEATAGKGVITYGLQMNSITVRGGAIRATAGDASFSCTAVASNEFTMEGGSLIALGGEAPGSRGADVKGAITGGTLTAIGQTSAFWSAPDPSGYADSAVTVNTEPTELGASAWNGADELNHSGSFKYVKIARYNPFTDIKEGAFYYDAVLWAVGRDPQITKGTSATTFSPNATCTRGQVVTFLWRAAGAPEPTMALNPFSDVKEGAFYYKAVLWAVQTGITKGVDATHFGPNQGCTRGQVVTFLHRAQGTPAPGSSVNPFVDVAEGAFYYDAVLWAVEKGVTNGTSPTTFAPNNTCTRGQIVTFLYRAQK